MRVLLDECLPRRLKHELPEHDVRTVPEMGTEPVPRKEVFESAASIELNAGRWTLCAVSL